MILEEYHQGKQGKYLNKYKTSKIENFSIESGVTLLKATLLVAAFPHWLNKLNRNQNTLLNKM